MKRTKTIIVILVLLIGTISLIGCATKPISQQHPDRWSNTFVGMSLDEFQRVWPEARHAGYVDNSDGWIFAPRTTRGTSKLVYFFFIDNKLVNFYER